jgi:hypothetical protein
VHEVAVVHLEVHGRYHFILSMAASLIGLAEYLHPILPQILAPLPRDDVFGFCTCKSSDPCSVSFGCLLSKRCGGEIDNILHLHS